MALLPQLSACQGQLERMAGPVAPSASVPDGSVPSPAPVPVSNPKSVDFRVGPPPPPPMPGTVMLPPTRPELQPVLPPGQEGARLAPALNGGTLLVLADGKTAVASDPDRDRLSLADLETSAVRTVPLTTGDEPGRLVEDAAGRVHVLLRGGGAIVAVLAATGAIESRRPVCPAPRGIAYQRGADQLHVACAGGELLALPAQGGQPTRQSQLDVDLRDVVLLGERLFVTTFRGAELLEVGADGKVLQRRRPPVALNLTRRGLALEGPATTRFRPGVAWRAIANPAGGLLMLHQRAYTGQIESDPQMNSGGYAGAACGGVVQSVLSTFPFDGAARYAPEIAGALLAVDVAVTSGGKVAVVSPADARIRGFGSVVLTGSLSAFSQDTRTGCVPEASFGGDPGPTPITDPAVVPTEPAWRETSLGQPTSNRLFGEVVAVAFNRQDQVVVQSREPAEIRVPATGVRIPLGGERLDEAGFAVFHSNTGAGIACASCHPGGAEDGHVWNLARLGPRRTQSLRGGVATTLPLHWDGDMRDLVQIADEVFTTRMKGPILDPGQKQALARWIESIPLLNRSIPSDPASVERGRALFSRSDVACASCHAGTRYTNNLNVEVGRGRAMQVPSLLGVSARAPYMHDGCAPSLAARFDPACGGSAHGRTEALSAVELAELQAFLESL